MAIFAASQITGAVYMLFVYRELGFEAGVLGMLFALGAVSSLTSALLADRVPQSWSGGPAMVVGLSLAVSLSATVIGLCVGIPLGAFLGLRSFRGRRFLMSVINAGMGAPPVVVGLLVTAIFLLTLLQRVFHGPLEAKWAGFSELTLAEGLQVLPAVALMFVLGIWPQLVIGFINGSVVKWVEGLTS